MPNRSGFSKNIIIFVVNNRSFVRAGKKKDIRTVANGPKHGLYDTALNEKAEYLINCIKQQ